MKKFLFSPMLAASALLLASSACTQQTPAAAGKRAEALPDAAWEQAAWISAADAPLADRTTNRAADGASWFLSTVTNDARVVSARWMTSGLGVYDLYVNGRLIGEEVLKPGFTHNGKTRRSFTYDITEVMKTGKGASNTLSAQVTPGWWGDKIVTPNARQGMRGTRCAFRGVLRLTFSDGSTRLYGTNLDDWKAGIAGPVKHAAIFDGETYDARERPGWQSTALARPVLNDEFHGEILPTDGAEVYQRPDLALAPVRAYVWKDIEGEGQRGYGKVVIDREYADGQQMTVHPGETLVVDFGQNCAAVPSFVFKAAEGTVLTCLPSEILNDGNGARSRGMDGPEGSVHRQNLRIAAWGIRLDYTFGPAKGWQTYLPRCTFFGYRYVSVTATADVILKAIRSIPVTSMTQQLETGRITTGNKLINKLISNTVWSQRSNYLSVPTDCPQRDERLGWTADTQVFAATGTFFANTLAFFRKWMRDLRDSQSSTGGFPGVAPLAQYGSDMMRVGWADAGVIVPWTIWKQFGDASIIDENWDAMERFMAHVAETKYDHTALARENGDYQWADWLSYEPLESRGETAFRKDENGRNVPKPEAVEYWNFLTASYWLSDARMMADMASATGRDAQPYRTMAEEARAYITERFLTPEGTFKVDILNTMQTPALFALRDDVVQGGARQATIVRLRENFKAHGNCLQTGFLGTSILMQTLTDNGMEDIAYDLLFQRRNPSWLYSIDNGATTMWERWNSYTLEKGMGPSGMNSFNHYAYGCVCQWLWETAAGICADPARPGFKHIIMRPVPDKRLGSLTAEYPSAAGLIRSAWAFEGSKWTWTFTIPEGATATVTLPEETDSKAYTAGTYTVEMML